MHTHSSVRAQFYKLSGLSSVSLLRNKSMDITLINFIIITGPTEIVGTCESGDYYSSKSAVTIFTSNTLKNCVKIQGTPGSAGSYSL